MFKPAFLFTALLALSGAAQAAEPASPFYLSASAGRVHAQTWCTMCEKETNFGKITAGYDLGTSSLWPGSQITSSVELSHFQSGHMDNESAMGAAYGMRQSFRATGVYYKATVRESQAFSLNARLGVAHVIDRIEDVYSVRNYGKNTVAAGLGVSYALDKNWSIQADYDRLQSSKLNMISAGVGYRF
jgi:outer membrane autotransporter protein